MEELLCEIQEILYCRARKYYPTKPDLAEDLLQDTNERVLTNAHVFYGDRSNMINWAYTIMNNIFIDQFRKKKTHPVSYISDFSDFEQLYINEESIKPRIALRILIKELRSKKQKIVMMLRINGYKYQEISDFTGYSLPDVKTIIRDAKINIRKNFDKYYNIL
ncbi:MAG: RNA polymerase sigma factor [Atribacterota bacterium]|nr:RNA polymerase sigma factor [Atribacterota bacterium]